MIQEIISNEYDFPKPRLANFGQGLAIANGENHRRQRKIMNPAFSYNNIKVCIQYMYSNCSSYEPPENDQNFFFFIFHNLEYGSDICSRGLDIKRFDRGQSE